MSTKIEARIEHIRKALAYARRCLHVESQGFAVRCYDIKTDQNLWRHGQSRWITAPESELRYPPCIRDADDLILMPLNNLGEPAFEGISNLNEIDLGQKRLHQYKARLAAGEEYV
jgi:hypothetical protein